MNEETDNRRPRNDVSNEADDGQPPSPRATLAFVIALAVIVIGGYFLLMKMVAMRHQEDCILSGRKDCVPIETPADR